MFTFILSALFPFLDADKWYNASYGAFIGLVILAVEFYIDLPAYWLAPVPVLASLLDKVIARGKVLVPLKGSFVDWFKRSDSEAPREMLIN